MFLELEPVFNNIGYKLPFSGSLDLSDEEFGGRSPFAAPVTFSGEVYNHAGMVELNIKANVKISTECDRCASPIDCTLTYDFFHVLVTKLNQDDNDEFILIESYCFDLDTLLREDVFLDLPNKFLCADDCKGICGMCGKNLNDGPCSCQKPGDPRLEVLRQLLDN